MSSADNIARTILDLGTIQAQGLRDAAAARAQGQEQVGQAWAQTLQSLGQIPGQVFQGVQQQKEQALKTQVQQLQVGAMQRAQAGEDQANKAIAGVPRNQDGTFDVGTLMQTLAQSPTPPNAETQERILKSIDGVNGVIKSFNQAKVDHAADLANVILTNHQPGEPVTADTVQLGIAAAKAANLATPADEAQFTQALGSGAVPEQVLKTIRGLGSKYAAEKPVVVPEGGTLVRPESGQVIAGGTPKPKTPAELAIDAATLGTPKETPTAQVSADALDRLKPPKTAADTEAELDAKAQGLLSKRNMGQALTRQEAADLKAYETRKTLTVDTSASAAATRLASTQQQQNAIQGRAQAFSENQAGRKEYVDKVATPYQTALTSAQTLRDTVAAAQGGNKVAANLQNLETAMAAVRAQGLSRINTTEIGAPASAGSLYDRVQAGFGKLTAGQPVPENLQKDMLQFADILEKAATVKYQKGRESLNKVYPGAQLPDESAPNSAPTTAPTTIGRFKIVGVQ